MKKTTLLVTTLMGATILGTGMTVNAENVVINPVNDLPLEVKASVATFNFTEETSTALEAIDFKTIDFDTPQLKGDVTVAAQLGNKDFGTKEVNVSVTTEGTGLEMDEESGFLLKAPQATIKRDKQTYGYTLDATEFNSELADNYKVIINAVEATEELPEV